MTQIKSNIILPALAYAVSVISFCFGVCFPLLSTGYKVFGHGVFMQDVNLLDSVVLFFESGDWFIAAIILLFTIVFPLLKYVEMGFRIFGKRQVASDSKWTKYAGSLDKWNMIDVFLVALLLLNFKMDYSIIKMELSLGATFVAIAVIMRIVTIIMIDRIKK